MSSDIVNPEAAKVDLVLKTIEAALVPVAEHAIQSQCPTLALPIIKQIVDAIVQGVSNELTKIAQEGATFLIIDGQVEHEKTGMSAALAALALAEKGGNPDEIQKAIDAYAAAQSALTNCDGGLQPAV